MRSKYSRRKRTQLIVMKAMLLLQLLFHIFRPLTQQKGKFQNKIIGEFLHTSITMENVTMKSLNHLLKVKLCIDQGRTTTLQPFLLQMENLQDQKVTKLALKYARAKLSKMETLKSRHTLTIVFMLLTTKIIQFITMLCGSQLQKKKMP
jgi:hypothetical protein